MSKFLSEKITKESNIMETVQKYPVIARALMDRGFHCIGCIAAQFETIGQGAKAHGMSDEQIDEMIEEMNNLIEEEK